MVLRLDFRRAVWSVPAFLLNILFLGTSHVLSRFPIQYWALYVYITVNLSLPFNGDVQAFYDMASSVLAILMISLSLLAFRRQGLRVAIVRTLQICSVSFLPLGIEIFFFDHSEWNLHVTEFQASYNLVPWFTNADLFFAMFLLFGASALLNARLAESVHPSAKSSQNAEMEAC